MKKIASVDFLIHELRGDPKKSEYFMQSPPKGIRTNFFINDTSQTSDNGTYLKLVILTSFIIATGRYQWQILL